MTYICGKWLKYLRNGKNIWEMTKDMLDMVFENRLKDVENELEIWELAKMFGKWLRYMVYKYLRNGISMLQMT